MTMVIPSVRDLFRMKTVVILILKVSNTGAGLITMGLKSLVTVVIAHTVELFISSPIMTHGFSHLFHVIRKLLRKCSKDVLPWSVAIKGCSRIMTLKLETAVVLELSLIHI